MRSFLPILLPGRRSSANRPAVLVLSSGFALAALVLTAGCLVPQQRRPSRRMAPVPPPPEIAALEAAPAPALPAEPDQRRSRPLSQASQVSQVSRGSSQLAPAPLAGEVSQIPVGAPSRGYGPSRREAAAWDPRPRGLPEPPPEVVLPPVRRAPEPAPVPEPMPEPEPEVIVEPPPVAGRAAPEPEPEPESVQVPEPPPPAAAGRDDDDDAAGRPETAGPAAGEPLPVPAIEVGIGEGEGEEEMEGASGLEPLPGREPSTTRKILDLLKRAVGIPGSDSSEEEAEAAPEPGMEEIRKVLEDDPEPDGAAPGAEGEEASPENPAPTPPQGPASREASSNEKLDEALRRSRDADRMNREQAAVHLKAAEEHLQERSFGKARDEALKAAELDPERREEVGKILLRINREESERPDSP